MTYTRLVSTTASVSTTFATYGLLCWSRSQHARAGGPTRAAAAPWKRSSRRVRTRGVATTTADVFLTRPSNADATAGADLESSLMLAVDKDKTVDRSRIKELALHTRIFTRTCDHVFSCRVSQDVVETTQLLSPLFGHQCGYKDNEKDKENENNDDTTPS